MELIWPWWRGKHQPPAMEEQCKPAEKCIAKEVNQCNSVLSCTQPVGHYLLCSGCWLCKVSLPAFSWGSWEFTIPAVSATFAECTGGTGCCCEERDVLLPADGGTQ